MRACCTWPPTPCRLCVRCPRSCPGLPAPWATRPADRLSSVGGASCAATHPCRGADCHPRLAWTTALSSIRKPSFSRRLLRLRDNEGFCICTTRATEAAMDTPRHRRAFSLFASALLSLACRPDQRAISPSANQSAVPQPGWIWCDDFEQDRLGQYF